MCDDENKMIGSKNRTQNLMKTLLNSGNIIEKFENIIKECEIKKMKYIDDEFYPQKSIIKEDQKLLDQHEWKRIEDQFPSNLFDNITPENIRQGCLTDCYFIVALIYAAQNIEDVKLFFHPKSSLKFGCVLVYFCFLGEKIPVIVDTLIPYKRSKSNVPLLSHPRSKKDSCWFALVEKAFAKACGGYFNIAYGESHFGVHILMDTFASLLSEMNDIQTASTPEIMEKLKNKVFANLLDLKKRNAMIGSYVTMSTFPNCTSKEIEESMGLLTDHAYYILDIREVQKKRFLKIRNPLAKFEWKGAYSKGSKEWTEQLRKDLNYTDDRDGSFWILYDDFIKYFKSICYSLKKEKTWKEMNVYGKIEGYLDGRTPCVDSRNTGCIPQWSIEFTKKTVVRLTYDFSGPETYHSLYICKNHGRKVDLITSEIEMKRSTTDSLVGGLEYMVEDFSEPFTFFLTRTKKQAEPCYYRILIESPDTNFIVKNFDDNFFNEKWNFASDQGIFVSPEKDQWNPFSSRSLITCKQWYVKFPRIANDVKKDFRICLFKTPTKGPLFVFVAKTAQKVSFTYKKMKYYNFKTYSVSDYEEFMVPIDDEESNFSKDQTDSVNNDDFNQYVIAVYRNKQDDINRFKFVVMSQTNFEFGLMPGPNPTKDVGYTIRGKLTPGENDGCDPKKSSVKNLAQFCLLFQKPMTKIYIDFYLKNATSRHKVYLQMMNSPGDKIDKFTNKTVYFEFPIRSKDLYDQVIWEITDISKPYALCVTRSLSNTASEYFANVFGSEQFKMFEIDGNGIGKSAPIYDNRDDLQKEVHEIVFPEVKFVEQPKNFAPKKK